MKWKKWNICIQYRLLCDVSILSFVVLVIACTIVAVPFHTIANFKYCVLRKRGYNETPCHFTHLIEFLWRFRLKRARLSIFVEIFCTRLCESKKCHRKKLKCPILANICNRPELRNPTCRQGDNRCYVHSPLVF